MRKRNCDKRKHGYIKKKKKRTKKERETKRKGRILLEKESRRIKLGKE